MMTTKPDAAALELVPQTNQCHCDLRTKLVGDGCYVCNPEYAKDHEEPPEQPSQEPVAQVVLRDGWKEDTLSNRTVTMIEELKCGAMLYPHPATLPELRAAAEKYGYVLTEADVASKYQEMIMAVSCKWPHESRYETALRYIRERETVTIHTPKNAMLEAAKEKTE